MPLKNRRKTTKQPSLRCKIQEKTPISEKLGDITAPSTSKTTIEGQEILPRAVETSRSSNTPMALDQSAAVPPSPEPAPFTPCGPISPARSALWTSYAPRPRTRRTDATARESYRVAQARWRGPGQTCVTRSTRTPSSWQRASSKTRKRSAASKSWWSNCKRLEIHMDSTVCRRAHSLSSCRRSDLVFSSLRRPQRPQKSEKTANIMPMSPGTSLDRTRDLSYAIVVISAQLQACQQRKGVWNNSIRR